MRSFFESYRPTIDATYWSAASVVVVQNALEVSWIQRVFRLSGGGGESSHLGESNERPPANRSDASLWVIPSSVFNVDLFHLLFTGTILDSEGNYAIELYTTAFLSSLAVWPLGTVKTISGQFKKSDLCIEHRLNVSFSVAWRPLCAAHKR